MLWDPNPSTRGGRGGGGYFWVTREPIGSRFFCLGIVARFSWNVEVWDQHQKVPTQSSYFGLGGQTHVVEHTYNVTRALYFVYHIPIFYLCIYRFITLYVYIYIYVCMGCGILFTYHIYIYIYAYVILARHLGLREAFEPPCASPARSHAPDSSAPNSFSSHPIRGWFSTCRFMLRPHCRCESIRNTRPNPADAACPKLSLKRPLLTKVANPNPKS